MRLAGILGLVVLLSVPGAECQDAVSHPTKHISASFRPVSVQSKTVFVSTYVNPRDGSGLAYPEPPTDIEKVREAVTLWPVMSEEQRTRVAQVKEQLKAWNRYVLVSDVNKADLVIIVRFGRDTSDHSCQRNDFDCPTWLRVDDSLYVYSAKGKPSLVWRAAQAGGLHLHKGKLALLRELQSDVQRTSKASIRDDRLPLLQRSR